jgi:hypothetical protein
MSRTIRLGGITLLAVLLASSARAGLPVRDGEATPSSVFEDLRRPRGFVPKDSRSAWNRFIDAVERSRGVIPRPALLDRNSPPPTPDLGDDFLRGFARERGLRKKLAAVSGYKATLGRARRWIQTLNPTHQAPLAPHYQRLSAEANAAEQILVGQIREDMLAGGRALDVILDQVERLGYVETTAQDAFGGLSRGLRQAFTAAAEGSAMAPDRRQTITRQLRSLQRLVDS